MGRIPGRSTKRSDQPIRLTRPGSFNKLRGLLRILARYKLPIVVIPIFAVFAVALVSKIIHPYIVANTEEEQLVDTSSQVTALKLQNAVLIRQSQALHTPSGILHEARKMGFVKPGEIPIVIEATGESEPLSTYNATHSPTVSRPSTESVLDRLLRHFRGQ